MPNLQRVETVRLGRVGRDCVEDVDQHQEEGHEERHPTLKDQVNRKLHMYVIRINLLQYSPDGNEKWDRIGRCSQHSDRQLPILGKRCDERACVVEIVSLV